MTAAQRKRMPPIRQGAPGHRRTGSSLHGGAGPVGDLPPAQAGCEVQDEQGVGRSREPRPQEMVSLLGVPALPAENPRGPGNPPRMQWRPQHGRERPQLQSCRMGPCQALYRLHSGSKLSQLLL